MLAACSPRARRVLAGFVRCDRVVPRTGARGGGGRVDRVLQTKVRRARDGGRRAAAVRRAEHAMSMRRSRDEHALITRQHTVSTQ